MKTKITLILIFFTKLWLCSNLSAQTVSGVPSNNGCLNSGIITSSTTGLGATPQYQLLRSGIVVAPVQGDNTQFTTNPVFTGLSTGIYVVNAKATASGTVYASANISVTDGYTPMTITTPTKVANCIGGTVSLTTTVTGGVLPFTYSISMQGSSTPEQISGSITSNSFSFNPLPANNYIVSVTDACGQSVTGATSISNPTVGLNDIKLGSIAYPYAQSYTNCSSPIILSNETRFQYISNSTVLSPADAANFTWKVRYQGQLYGKDTNSDGYSDLNGDGYSPLQATLVMPTIATKEGIEADAANMRVVLIDNCGNTKEFPITLITGNTILSNCGGSGVVRITSKRLICLPIDVTFTNVANPSDVIVKTMTNLTESYTGFTPGATYHITYIDAEGKTTGNFNLGPSQNIFIPATASVTATQSNFGVQQNLDVLGYGKLLINITPYQVGDVISYTITASDNPLAPVGYTASAPLDNSGNVYLPKINPDDPTDYWPKGNYTLSITAPCGTRSLNVAVKGYVASLSGNTITPVCGGFNYVMNGNFDVPSAYQVIIISGPSSVGQTRDLASTTQSLPFNGLSYGTYIFGLRIKGGTQNVFTQTVTYDANNAIKVDKTNTGGFVCATGATNGVLTISATTDSPAPGNVMEYALSTDGGVNFGPYQSSNVFNGLTDDTYFFRVKDGCGNVITQSVQIGVAAAPQATANGLFTPATICNMTAGDVQLDIDIFGALSYSWTGPGINISNQNQKDPLVNYSDLIVGANNYTCTVVMGAPCNSSTVSNLTINVNPNPTILITDPAFVCTPGTVNITEAAVTSGSDAGLTYTYFTDDLATVPVIDPTAISTRGTYYIKGTNTNGCSTIVPVNVAVGDLPTAVIVYLGTPYCQIGTATPEQLETAGGTYSSDTGIIIDPDTGEIDLEASTTGDHTITYTFTDGSCSNTVTTTITINALPVAAISYPNTPYCNRGTALPVETGVANGIYTSDSGLSINQATGEIDLANSTPGTYTIIYSFTNGSCSDTTTATITITPTVLPLPLADLTAECSIIPIAPTLTDPCAGTITATTSTSFPVTAQGTTAVTWSFDYGNGYTQTANQNIIIDDVTAPVVPVLADVTGECSATPAVPTTTDNCSGTITGTTTTIFPITAQGTTVVIWSFDDGNGNISTANQNVIIDDITAPVVPVLADLTGECSVTPTAPTAADTCSGTITGTTTTVFPITTQGTTVVIWSFDDGNGNISTANQNVIIDDITAPVVPVLADLTGECSVTPTAPTAADNCSGIITGTTTTVFPITTQGTTVVIWSFDDGNGNISTANQNVIIDDVTAPVVPVLADLTGECSVTPTAPTAADNCSGTITGTTTTVFPITTQGTTVVIWSFDDGNGNISTANQNVIIDDITAPVVPVLADLTGECSVTPTAPTAVDNCSGTITGTTTIAFPITTQGTTVIIWSFDDGNGNISTANQNVIIDDVTAPVIPVLADVTGECSATPAVPTTTDNCSGTITGTTTTVFPITAQGTTVVIWSFDDGNGNISTVNQNVIIDDVTPPVAPVLAAITGQCNVTPPTPTAIDTCSGVIAGTTTTVFPITEIGTTTITWTFVDGNGNSVTANQDVIISQVALIGTETANCSAVQPGYNITLSVTGQAPYKATGTGAPGTWSGNTWTSGLISSGTNYNVALQDAGACNTVTVTGVSPNCCRFNVICPTFQPLTVSCYDELPTAVSLTEAEFEALGNGDGRISNTRCGVVEITASNSADPGCNANAIRTYTINEYEDVNKNGIRDAGENTLLNSAICTQTILVHDTTAPVFVEPLPQTTISAECATIPPVQTFTATDNCSTASVSFNETRVDGDCESRYSLIRTWTASDECGNQNSFVQTINVSCVEEVYNAISSNGDGINDSFFIKGIDCYPGNSVKIYNRYGVIVYEKEDYDNVTDTFQGFSNGRATVAKGNKLPTGTYFYTLEYDSDGKKIQKAGYLYINNQ